MIFHSQQQIYKRKIITIHIQNPKVNFSKFDYIIAPNHDKISGKNLIKSTGAIHQFTKENIKEVEKLKNELSKKDQEKKKEAKSINEKIQNKEYVVKKLATENKELYGSVKPTEIAKTLNEFEKIEIHPSLIQPVKEIKSLGVFKVILNLHSEIQSQISIKVISQENTK